MKRIFQITALLLICMISTCAVQTTQGGDGGATETINATLIISDSTAEVTITSDTAVKADIMIFNDRYNPVTEEGFCDSAKSISEQSRILFNSLNGTYNIIIFDRLSQKSLAFNSIAAGPSIDDTLKDTLSYGGSIEGNVFIDQPSEPYKSMIKVYLSGTPFHTGIDSAGAFQIKGIPQGTYFIKATVSNSKNSIERSVGKEILVQSLMNTDNVQLFFSE